MIHTLRNIPLARVDRTMALAYSLNQFGDTRLDSVFILGTSSRGVGFLGKTYIVDNEKNGCHKLPVEEYWETDLHLPPTAKLGLSGFGSTPEVVGWFHRRFSKMIMHKINSAILRANKAIPKEVNLRCVGTNESHPHAVGDFMRECGKHLTEEESKGNNPPVSASDMALALAIWSLYSGDICAYCDDMPECDSTGGLMSRILLEAWSLSKKGDIL
jgi:hypothetical protein